MKAPIPAASDRSPADPDGIELRAQPGEGTILHKKEARSGTPAARPRRRWRKLAIAALLVLTLLVIARLFLPSVVRWYVNRALDQSELYDGVIGDVHVHLWRGAYTIHDVRVIKTIGSVPVPFFSSPKVDLAIEWPALLHGTLVGRMTMEQPELNFVDGGGTAQDQTGTGGPWLEMLRDLFPFRINSAVVRDGTIHFRAFRTNPPVDVWLSRVEGSIENLTNVHDETTPLFAKVRADALAMDRAKLEYEMKIDPSSYRPTFQLAVRLLDLDVTTTNALARAYGGFDFEKGWLDLVIEMDAKEGGVKGYVKPLFRNLQVFSLDKDLRDSNMLVAFWEALVGVAAGVLRNPARDQVGTVIPFRGDLTQPHSDLLASIGNLLRNAFVRAYLPTLHGTVSEITFAPAMPSGAK